MYDAGASARSGVAKLSRDRGCYRSTAIPVRAPMINCRFWEMDKSAIWDPEIDLTWQVPVEPANWRMLRDARLAALLESPQAFLANHAHESQWDELKWQEMIKHDTWVVAREATYVIAVARSVRVAAHDKLRYLESIWVAPTHRKRGVCRALIDRIAETERQAGVTTLLLWVLEHNHDAYSAYKALGFEPTGDSQFLDAVQQDERRLRLQIS
jgi:ribosomal protein S18 acetylase RimI-like enzyme